MKISLKFRVYIFNDVIRKCICFRQKVPLFNTIVWGEPQLKNLKFGVKKLEISLYRIV